MLARLNLRGVRFLGTGAAWLLSGAALTIAATKDAVSNTSRRRDGLGVVGTSCLEGCQARAHFLESNSAAELSQSSRLTSSMVEATFYMARKANSRPNSLIMGRNPTGGGRIIDADEYVTNIYDKHE